MNKLAMLALGRKVGGSGGGGSSKIIDVVELPSSGQSTDTIYRIIEGTFIYNGMY
jgi:hypothetical protein